MLVKFGGLVVPEPVEGWFLSLSKDCLVNFMELQEFQNDLSLKYFILRLIASRSNGKNSFSAVVKFISE